MDGGSGGAECLYGGELLCGEWVCPHVSVHGGGEQQRLAEIPRTGDARLRNNSKEEGICERQMSAIRRRSSQLRAVDKLVC